MLKKTLDTDGGPDPDEEVVTVASYPTIVEADLVREELQAAGIDVWVANATVAQTLTTIQETGVTIQVRGDDAEKARGVILALESAPQLSEDEINKQIDESVAGGNGSV